MDVINASNENSSLINSVNTAESTNLPLNYEITNNYHLDSKHFEEYEGEVKPYLLIG